MEENNEKEEVTLKELLVGEIAAQIEALNGMEPGSKEHTAAANDVATLYKALVSELDGEQKNEEANARLIAEAEHFDKELELKKQQAEMELKLKELEIEKLKSDSFWDKVWKGADIVLKVGGIAATVIFNYKAFITGLKFEETGTVASQFNKWIFSKFKPNKLD